MRAIKKIIDVGYIVRGIIVKYRILFIAAVTSMAIVLCAFVSIEAKYSVLETNAGLRKSEYALDRYYFNMLTYKEQLLYNAVLEALNEYSTETDILPYTYDTHELERTIRYLTADYPEYFYFDASMTTLSRSWNRTRISLSYFDTPEMIEAMKDELKMSVENALLMFSGTENSFQTELELHDYLIRNCSYAGESESKESSLHNTAYGALVLGSAYPDGYALGLKLLFNNYGISSCIVFGEAGGNPHMWNMVYIDGSYYHVDAAWDDADLSFAPDLRFHGYFNLSDSAMYADHTPENDDAIPAADSDLSYYKVNGLCVESQEELYDAVMERLRTAVGENAEYIELYLGFGYNEDKLNETVCGVIEALNSKYLQPPLKQVCRCMRASKVSGAVTVQIFYN